MSILIGDNKLTLQQFYDVAVNKFKVELTDTAKAKIVKSREVIEKGLKNNNIIYGVTSGFGSLKDVFIKFEDLQQLQYNLIRSHAVGIGEPAPNAVVRGMMLLRLTCFANGNSGVRLCTAEKIVECLNKDFYPYVPVKGTVGASGDLCPLSHMVMSMLGESQAFDFTENKFVDSMKVLNKLNITPMDLHAKEGLALNNGTQFITSWTALACYEAVKIKKLCNLVTATTYEALHATTKALDADIHHARPHKGQIEAANELLKLLSPESEIQQTHSNNKVQDAYSLRCAPQVHGAAFEIIDKCVETVEIEFNSSNDNPLVFGHNDKIVSGGNFHGMPIAVCADQLALAMAILCNISERRLERMVNHSLNKFMPSFLVNDAGLNSGFMIVQYASAAIVAENRQLANPACVHNIPTCEGTEDVVSMGGWACRKANQSVENTYNVLSYELFTACQALDFTKEKPVEMVNKIKTYVREQLKIPRVVKDVYMKDYIAQVNDFVKSQIFNL
ncbi:aromatic amino acid lyase [Catovirus CTV1]|uniref:histidine ammonia-lyase n=1 Tax=Catovirus CTV1 TaxID=1977631 RepID=A0A1V0S940_9VIRU|nr:aromatic amino acid lyase [Catovirus CTV1]